MKAVAANRLYPQIVVTTQWVRIPQKRDRPCARAALALYSRTALAQLAESVGAKKRKRISVRNYDNNDEGYFHFISPDER